MSAVPLICGVPQGSVLGPVLFILYVADLAVLVESHGLTPHQYADDTQIYGSCSPSHVDDLSSTLSGCVNDVADSMHAVKPTPTLCREDGTAVVHDQPLSELTSYRHIDSRLDDHCTSVLGTRPGHLRRL